MSYIHSPPSFLRRRVTVVCLCMDITRRALTELRELWLNMHALSGSIPPSFGALSKLTRLHLSFNRFSGARAEPSALYVFLSRAWLI